MKAGRELDALVAEKVMGFVRQSDGWYLKEPNTWVHPHSHDNPLPNYSTSIADAFEVVEKMRGLDMIKVDDGWMVGDLSNGFTTSEGIVEGQMQFFAIAPTLPAAICLAALKAVGVEAPA